MKHSDDTTLADNKPYLQICIGFVPHICWNVASRNSNPSTASK